MFYNESCVLYASRQLYGSFYPSLDMVAMKNSYFQFSSILVNWGYTSKMYAN